MGHAWYRQKFIVPYQRGTETETRFIPARVTDNRFTNAEYVKVLQNLTGWQKRAGFGEIEQGLCAEVVGL